MFKKIGIILLFVVAVGARHAVPLQGLAYAQQPPDPCPPECVTDSMEIITYYPSPYGYYEELRGDKIIVGDSDNSYIDETNLPPKGTITFEPLDDDPDSSDGRLYEGSLYYQKGIGGTKGKFRLYDGLSWQDLGGGGVGATGVKNCDFIGTDADGNLICSRSSLYGKVHDTSQCEGSGGEVYEETNGVKHCKFTASACPSGWISYLNWTATRNMECADCSSCTTSRHAYQNMTVDTCVYSGSRCQNLSDRCGAYSYCKILPPETVCYSQIIEIGCY